MEILPVYLTGMFVGAVIGYSVGQLVLIQRVKNILKGLK